MSLGIIELLKKYLNKSGRISIENRKDFSDQTSVRSTTASISEKLLQSFLDTFLR